MVRSGRRRRGGRRRRPSFPRRAARSVRAFSSPRRAQSGGRPAVHGPRDAGGRARSRGASRARARREREDVEGREGELLDEAAASPRTRPPSRRGSRRSGRWRGGAAGSRSAAREASARKRDGRDSAPHPAEDGVGARLERQVKVGDDDARGRHELDERLARLHRLERGEPDAGRRGVLLQPREERDEARPAVLPEGREVDPARTTSGTPASPRRRTRVLDLLRRRAPLRSRGATGRCRRRSAARSRPGS